MKRPDWLIPLLTILGVFLAGAIGLFLYNAQSAEPPVGNAASKHVAAISAPHKEQVQTTWIEKFDEDPIELFTLVLAIATAFLWFDTNGLRRLGNKQAEDVQRSLEISARAADAAMRENELSRQVFIAEYRPWISVSLLANSAFEWQDSSGRMNVAFELKNSGRTPAKEVGVHVKLAVAELLDEGNLREVQLSVIDEAINTTTRYGMTIFPGDTKKQGHWVSLSESDTSSNTADGRVPAVLLGCVTYKSSVDDGMHYTAFMFGVLREYGGGVSHLVRNEPVMPGSISLQDIAFIHDGADAT